MNKNLLMAWCICLLTGIMAGPVNAETYTWTDQSGTVHFTEDYSSVPKKYRKKVGRRGDVGATAPEQNSAGEGSDGQAGKQTEPAAAKADNKSDAGAAEGVYGGKPLDEWRREFSDREALLRGMDKRIKEIEATVKKPASYISREQIQALSQEHQEAVQKYNDALAQYNQLLDTAKKAGVPFTIKNQ